MNYISVLQYKCIHICLQVSPLQICHLTSFLLYYKEVHITRKYIVWFLYSLLLIHTVSEPSFFQLVECEFFNNNISNLFLLAVIIDWSASLINQTTKFCPKNTTIYQGILKMER